MIGAIRKSRSGTSRASAVRFMGCVTLVFFLSLLLTARYHTIDRLGYEKAALERQVRELERQHQALSLEIARKSSLERIEAVALSDLGMVRSTAAVEIGPAAAPAAGVEEDRIAVLVFGTAASPEIPWWQDIDSWLARIFSRVARAESRP